MKKMNWILAGVLGLGLAGIARAAGTPDAALPEAASPPSTQPALVSVDYNRAEPKTVFDDLAKRGGFTVEYDNNVWGDEKPTITLKADNRLLVEVLRDAMVQAHVQTSELNGENPPDGVLALRQSGWNMVDGKRVHQNPLAGVAVPVGGRLLIARSISVNSQLAMGSRRPDRRDAYVQFILFSLPVDRPLGMGNQPVLDEAMDDKGNSLMNPNNYSDRRVNVGRNQGQLNVSLQLADRSATKIAELAGSVLVLEALTSDTLEVADILKAKNVKKTVAGLEMTIGPVSQDQRQVKVEMVIETHALNDGDREALRQMIYSNPPRLIGGNWRDNGQNVEQGGPASMKMTLNFYSNQTGADEAAGAPEKLVWTIPLTAEQRALPFVFKDLPLP